MCKWQNERWLNSILLLRFQGFDIVHVCSLSHGPAWETLELNRAIVNVISNISCLSCSDITECLPILRIPTLQCCSGLRITHVKRAHACLWFSPALANTHINSDSNSSLVYINLKVGWNPEVKKSNWYSQVTQTHTHTHTHTQFVIGICWHLVAVAVGAAVAHLLHIIKILFIKSMKVITSFFSGKSKKKRHTSQARVKVVLLFYSKKQTWQKRRRKKKTIT